MMRHLYMLALVFVASGRLWAQGDLIKFRDSKKDDPSQTFEILSMSFKQVKYNLFVKGELAGTFTENSSEIREVSIANDRKPYEFTVAEQNMAQGQYDEAIKRFQKALRTPNCPDPVRQMGLMLIARCFYRDGQADMAIASVLQMRRELPESFYLSESYTLQFEACRLKNDVAGMEKTLADYMEESKNRSMPDWKNGAELLHAELYEMQGKWNLALANYAKYESDGAVGKQAKLGQLRCLAALSNWAQLKTKADAILSFARGQKSFDEQLLTGAYNARGDWYLHSQNKAKEALLDYMRGVLVLNSSGDATREHEAALAKAAIACARLANELRDQDRATYKQRARELQAELQRYYPGSSWSKAVGDAIQGIR